MTRLSVIIPSYEPLSVLKAYLPKIIDTAFDVDSLEFILVDACQEAPIATYCDSIGVKYIPSDKVMRASQLNLGAASAKSQYFFFLHLDSIPPEEFDKHMLYALENGSHSGCFQMRFIPTTRFLSFFAFFTRFHWRVARGGDQGLFVKKEVFNQVGKFDTGLEIMEDMAICQKLENLGGFEILKGPIYTSARKYQTYGQWRLQAIYVFITILFWLGFPNPKLVKVYRRLLGE